MTLPAVGVTWDGAGFGNIDSRFLERGKLRQLLIRDGRGSATDISPHNDDGSVAWSPFAEDGNWRDDLCAFVRVKGVWDINRSANEGWHIAGAFPQNNGPATKPHVKKDNSMVLMSNHPFDTTISETGEPFSFTAVETAKPLIRRLRNNLPLNTTDGAVLVELPGEANTGWSKPLDAVDVDRQILLVSEFKKHGLPVYTVDGYAVARLADIGASKKDKHDSEAAELTYEPLSDGFFMAVVDGRYRPIVKHTWVGGAGWDAFNDTP